MHHARLLRSSVLVTRSLRQASPSFQHSRRCSSKPLCSKAEQILYEEYKTPNGDTYRLDFNAQKKFKAEDWQKFERAFDLEESPTDEEIDKWVDENSEDWEVVRLTPESLNSPRKTHSGPSPEMYDPDEFEKPVRSVRELRKSGMLKREKRQEKKERQALRALKMSKGMEMAAVRALDADGGGQHGGMEICRARLSDNLRDLTIVFRSDCDDIEMDYDEMGKKVKTEIARNLRPKFIPKVWFRRANEEDQKRAELEQLFTRIARERG